MFSDHPAGFVSIGEAIPDVILEIRYYSSFNFIGERIDGYEQPIALMTGSLRPEGGQRRNGFPGIPAENIRRIPLAESRGPFHALGKGRL